MTPLERAAQAAQGVIDEARKWGENPAEHSEKIARAVLQAIREPSKSMKEAGADGPLTTSHGDDESFDYVSEDDAATCWQAMIDAALEEG